ncbi:MAG: hypothetical protein ACK55Z_10670, partial [bacterium]
TGQGAVVWSDLHSSDWMRNDSMMRGFGGGREEEEIGGTRVGLETVGRSGALPRPLELYLSRSATLLSVVCLHVPPRGLAAAAKTGYAGCY